PRFAGENGRRNRELVERLSALAAEYGVRPAQLAIAWVLARQRNVVPVMGARTRAQLEETLGALDLRLEADDLRRVESAIPPGAVAGTRYDQHQMQMLDSERS